MKTLASHGQQGGSNLTASEATIALLGHRGYRCSWLVRLSSLTTSEVILATHHPVRQKWLYGQ